MKIRSIEPTPSPNAMKLNMDESLPTGQNYRFTVKEKSHAPEHLSRLLSIEGVTGVFQVLDFISLERHPKADWEDLLSKARAALGDGMQEIPSASENTQTSTEDTDHTDQDYLEVAVYIQQLRGIPMQIKLIKGEEERRVGLPERFKEAVFQVQEAVSNLILERKWVEQSPRYGELSEVGEQVAEELAAAYDQKRLMRMVEQVLSSDSGESASEEVSEKELEQALQLDDWEKRYRALEQVEPTLQTIPLLERALQDEKAAIRRLVVVILGYLEREEVLPVLITALRDRSPIVRRTAGDTLSDLGFPAAIPAMCQALEDRNKLVRWRAARFLFEVGDDTAISALQKATNDLEFEVRMQAQIALERIERGEEASGTVWQQMTRKMREE